MTRLAQLITLPSWLHRHPERPPTEVRPGGRYRRDLEGWSEIAEVLAIVPDAQGIDHVTYNLTIERSTVSPAVTRDRRMLNLESFRELFRDLAQA